LPVEVVVVFEVDAVAGGGTITVFVTESLAAISPPP
jgi:hypothetical protein